MAKKKYTVQTPVRHDGKDYAPGESIDLDIPDDHHLLVDGVIAGGKAVKAAKPTEPEAPIESPVIEPPVIEPVAEEEQGA